MIRCAYGNYFNIGGVDHSDFKIDSAIKTYKTGIYLSTNDKSFNHGNVGQQIKELFPDKCKYEI